MPPGFREINGEIMYSAEFLNNFHDNEHELFELLDILLPPGPTIVIVVAEGGEPLLP
jgi:hypothetical protein